MSAVCRFTALVICLLQVLSSTDADYEINFRSRRSDASDADSYQWRAGMRNKGWLKNEAITGTQYSSIALACPAVSVPFPSFTWFKDGERISQSETSIDEEGNTTDDDEVLEESGSCGRFCLYGTSSTLYLDCLDMLDEGNYTCVAEVGDSRRVREIQLTLDAVENPSDDVLMQCAQKGRAPKIYKRTGYVLETSGNAVLLFCRATGYPSPTVKWMDLNNVTIQDGDNFRITDNGDLIVKDIGEYSSTAMSSTYICEATNDFGSDISYSRVYPV